MRLFSKPAGVFIQFLGFLMLIIGAPILLQAQDNQIIGWTGLCLMVMYCLWLGRQTR